jgi:hypothetical protein
MNMTVANNSMQAVVKTKHNEWKVVDQSPFAMCCSPCGFVVVVWHVGLFAFCRAQGIFAKSWRVF